MVLSLLLLMTSIIHPCLEVDKSINSTVAHDFFGFELNVYFFQVYLD